MNGFRTVTDSFGKCHIPNEKYWDIQTQRNKENFQIGTEEMPLQIIHAYAIIKKAAALANEKLGKLDKEKAKAIAAVADEIIAGKLNDHFPLRIWQTGSGTQSHMNVNEVIANRGNELLTENKTLHPNDDVNMSQSSNDTFPTAMHIAAYLEVTLHLLPALAKLKETFMKKATQFNDIVKIGRTHLQDATPLTLGQEISGWAYSLKKCEEMIITASQQLEHLAIGGTAVGTGINAHPQFAELVVAEINKITNVNFTSSANKFHALTSHDEISFVHGALVALAADLMKIANDIRWLASGPRAGIGEIKIAALEQGSSIMPGKVNPTQAEALTMVCVQVMGNHTTITIAASQGNFELNVYKPVIIYNFLQSVRLLTDAMISFNDKCAMTIEPNLDVIDQHLNESLMLVTALNPHIGYDKAAEIAKKAYNENTTLKEAALKLGYVTEEEFTKWVDPKKMTNPQ